jgi:integrase
VFEDIRAMVRWAVARGDLDHNPIDGMKGPPISKPRTRVLSDDEIRTLWQSLDQVSVQCQRVIRLCLITGQRVGEVSGLRAVEIIREGPWQVSRKHVTDTINERQDRLGVAHFTPHDLRRTALTKMAELGVAPIVLGHIANHRTTTKAGVTLGVYVQHAYEREKREALELWADRLQGIISGGADVVAMRGKA